VADRLQKDAIMKPKPKPYVLHVGRLREVRDVTTRERAKKLIETFVEKYADYDRIRWSCGNTAARSELVVDPDDRTLRIDLQPPPPGQVNIQLQAGADSIACVLMECDREFLAEEFKEAFLESLARRENARMVWRFLASPIELQVLNSLDAWEPRGIKLIIDHLARRGSGPALVYHLPYMTPQISQALKVLAKNNLVRRQGELAWVLTPEGIEYS